MVEYIWPGRWDRLDGCLLRWETFEDPNIAFGRMERVMCARSAPLSSSCAARALPIAGEWMVEITLADELLTYCSIEHSANTQR